MSAARTGRMALVVLVAFAVTVGGEPAGDQAASGVAAPRRPAPPRAPGASSASGTPRVPRAPTAPDAAPDHAAASAQMPPDAATLARGAYLAKAGDCAGCHTAPRNGVPFAGGLGLASPFGTIVSTNITPDPRYGIGRYTYGDFARALRRGIARGGKPLYPAMPYTSFAKLDDADLRALYAFVMHGVKPVAKPSPRSEVAFPFDQRWALRAWQWLFVPHRPFTPNPRRDAQWNRGAYLVQGLGHCGACHTPRGLAYQERGQDESSAQFLVGGVNDHWFAPNLTGDPGSGLGRLSVADIARFLKTGHGGGAAAFGSMVTQVEDSTQYLSDGDAAAIAHYLKSLPAHAPSGTWAPGRDPARGPIDRARVPDALSPGYHVYRSFCAACHRADGAGVSGVFPALAGNPAVLAEDTTSLIRLVVEGGNSASTLTGPPRQRMPAFAGTLADVQIAQVLTYVRTAWGNDAQPITANDVRSLREILQK